jgi:hypothetical protein
MDIIWKGIAGGFVTAAIVWLSRRGNNPARHSAAVSGFHP